MKSLTMFFREEQNKQEAERLARELEEQVSPFFIFLFFLLFHE